MQNEHPLTLTLSPAAGEREEILAPQCDSLNPKTEGRRRTDTLVCPTSVFGLNGEHFQTGVNGFPLPIRWGEGQGEGLWQLNRHG